MTEAYRNLHVAVCKNFLDGIVSRDRQAVDSISHSFSYPTTLYCMNEGCMHATEQHFFISSLV